MMWNPNEMFKRGRTNSKNFNNQEIDNENYVEALITLLLFGIIADEIEI